MNWGHVHCIDVEDGYHIYLYPRGLASAPLPLEPGMLASSSTRVRNETLTLAGFFAGTGA